MNVKDYPFLVRAIGFKYLSEYLNEGLNISVNDFVCEKYSWVFEDSAMQADFLDDIECFIRELK